MGLIKSAADLAYTFRFLALLVTPFKKTKAYEKGIIDENGKRLKKPPFSLILSAAPPQEDADLLTQMTCIPSLARDSAIVRPIPRPAPVTRAILDFVFSSLICF